MVDPAVAATYRRRLGVGAAPLPADASADLGAMGSLDVLMAWEKERERHGGVGPSAPCERSCEIGGVDRIRRGVWEGGDGHFSFIQSS